jgi:2-polyprenyl-3-methyl-5-hydroxy-6-metoxy-1,4-benzoquinol methylase
VNGLHSQEDNMSRRSTTLELIDKGPSYYTPDEYDDCLQQLDRIGHLLGGDRATFTAMDSLGFTPQSILDVGCGGGLFAIKLAKRYPHSHIVGIDISAEAIAFANKQQAIALPIPNNVSFIKIDQPQLDYSANSFDLVMSTLMCHHLTDHEIVAFLQQAYVVAKEAVILNDLHRHWLATAAYALVAPIFFRNRLTICDGLLSIRRSFTRKEWIAYLDAAGIPAQEVTISWHWVFRWIVVIDKRTPLIPLPCAVELSL